DCPASDRSSHRYRSNNSSESFDRVEVRSSRVKELWPEQQHPATPPGNVEKDQPVKRRRSDPEKEREREALIKEILGLGKELQGKNPKWKPAQVLAEIKRQGRFRRCYSDETLKQIIYGSYPFMKKLGIAGLTN